MSKILNKKQSCFLSEQINLNYADSKTLILKLLRQGFSHFYLAFQRNESVFIKVLKEVKNVYENITIYVAHDKNCPFWIEQNIVNLPILIKEKASRTQEIYDYLKRFCDISILTKANTIGFWEQKNLKNFKFFLHSNEKYARI